MAEITLQARSPLEHLELRRGDLSLRELTDLALVSIATGEADQPALAEALNVQMNLVLPPIGESVISEDGGTRLMGLQPGLWLFLFEHPGQDPLQALHQQTASALPETTRLTDQSDAWMFLELQGSECAAVLERLCPVDLHPDCFKAGHLARTVFELMGVILIRTDIDRWTMLSARSTASSFSHAVITAVESVT